MKKVIALFLSIMIAVCALVPLCAAIEYKKGDVNGDGSLNNKDVVRLFRYTSGDKVECVREASDFNGDGLINNKDVVLLFRYLSIGNFSETDTAKVTETETEQIIDVTLDPDELPIIVY